MINFHKSDLPKMAIASAVTAVVFLIVIYSNTNRPVPPTGNRISWDEATTMRTDYLHNAPLKVEYIDPKTGLKVIAPLEGFRLNAALIDEVINHNKNGVGGDVKADELMVYFGSDGMSGPVNGQFPNMRMIFAGIKDNILLKNKDASNIADSSIFDRADPVPPNPPTIN